MSDSMAEMRWVTFFQVMTARHQRVSRWRVSGPASHRPSGVRRYGGVIWLRGRRARCTCRITKSCTWPTERRASTTTYRPATLLEIGGMHTAMDFVFVATAVPDGAAVWRRWAEPIRPTYFTGELKPIGEPASAPHAHTASSDASRYWKPILTTGTPRSQPKDAAGYEWMQECRTSMLNGIEVVHVDDCWAASNEPVPFEVVPRAIQRKE